MLRARRNAGARRVGCALQEACRLITQGSSSGGWAVKDSDSVSRVLKGKLKQSQKQLQKPSTAPMQSLCMASSAAAAV
jgi:hypothetical protein